MKSVCALKSPDIEYYIYGWVDGWIRIQTCMYVVSAWMFFPINFFSIFRFPFHSFLSISISNQFVVAVFVVWKREHWMMENVLFVGRKIMYKLLCVCVCAVSFLLFIVIIFEMTVNRKQSRGVCIWGYVCECVCMRLYGILPRHSFYRFATLRGGRLQAPPCYQLRYATF